MGLGEFVSPTYLPLLEDSDAISLGDRRFGEMWKLFTSGEVSLTRRLKVTPNLGNEYPRRMLDLKNYGQETKRRFSPANTHGRRSCNGHD